MACFGVALSLTPFLCISLKGPFMLNHLLAIRDIHSEHNLEIHQNDKTESLQGRKRSPDSVQALDLFEFLTNAPRMVVPLFSSILVEMI